MASASNRSAAASAADDADDDYGMILALEGGRQESRDKNWSKNLFSIPAGE